MELIIHKLFEIKLNTCWVIRDECKEVLALLGNDEDGDFNDDVEGNEDNNAELIFYKNKETMRQSITYNIQQLIYIYIYRYIYVIMFHIF